MTFDLRERSIAGGAPVRLYEFSRGPLSWLYCSADRAVTWRAAAWAAVAISDDGVRLTGEASADVLKVTAPASLEVAAMFRGAPPSAEIMLTVRDFHYGEADLASSARVAWIGSVSGVRWPAADRCEISCESLSASMGRPGLRMTWERNCPHTVYDRRCGVDRALFGVAATLQGVDGVRATSAAFAAHLDDRFSGGFIEWGIGSGEVERRAVERHTGSDLVLLGGTQGLSIGQAVTVYPGCRQTTDYCAGTFNNLVNFGGIAHLPGKSPFDGDPVY